MELKPEKALAEERGTLERFKGKAKEVAVVLLFVSALSASPGVVSEVYAEKSKSGVRTEQIQKKQENEINRAGLTESSTWSLGMMETIRNEARNVKTREDAIRLIGKGKEIRLFFQELYAPTKGKLIKWWFINSREYSRDDIVLLYTSVKELDGLLQEFEIKYNMDMREIRYKIVRPIEEDLENQYLEKVSGDIKALEEKINRR